MEFAFEYWHWIVFGIALMLSEIFIGSFFIIWFGFLRVNPNYKIWFEMQDTYFVKV